MKEAVQPDIDMEFISKINNKKKRKKREEEEIIGYLYHYCLTPLPPAPPPSLP